MTRVRRLWLLDPAEATARTNVSSRFLFQVLDTSDKQDAVLRLILPGTFFTSFNKTLTLQSDRTIFPQM